MISNDFDLKSKILRSGIRIETFLKQCSSYETNVFLYDLRFVHTNHEIVQNRVLHPVYSASSYTDVIIKILFLNLVLFHIVWRKQPKLFKFATKSSLSEQCIIADWLFGTTHQCHRNC